MADGARPNDAPTLDDVRASIREFVDRRDWEPYHDPKNLAMAVGSEAGELLDILRWIHSDQVDDRCEDPETRNRLRDEIADVAICLLMLCDRLEIDLLEAIEDKLETNRRKYPPSDPNESAN